MLKNISIYDKNGTLLNEFSILFFQRKTFQLKLDQEKFYQRFSGNIPEETFEMLIDESAPFTIPSLVDYQTHIHTGNDGERYICYPRQINSLQEATEIAKSWCLITVFHITQHADSSWFESFGDWMVLAAKSNKETPDSFKEFPLWIQNGFLKWKVVIS